jgi:hypothetical protein
MGTVTYNLIQFNGNSNQQPDPKWLEQSPTAWSKMMGTVTNNMIQNHHVGTGCWLFFLVFWIRLLVTVPIILDQVVGYCSYHFGSDCWLLFPLLWMKLLTTVPIISWSKLLGTVTNSLIQNDWNSYQQPDPKWWEQ